jgi:hypothetical protein
MSINNNKNISQCSEIKKIETDSVTYLFKLNDGRLCVGTHAKKMHIFKYSDGTFINQITISNYTSSITKIIQLKNDLIIFPTKDGDINFIKILEDSYEIHYTIKLDKKIIKKFQNYISFIELKINQIAILVNDFGDDKIILYNIKGDNYEQTTIIKLSKKEFNLSLDIVEIPKLNQIAYYSNKGLYFYDLRNFEIKKSMENINGFEWTNTMTLFDDDYLILGSIYASCNEENDKNFYLIKCSTYEVIDSYLCEELDYMFCTAMKVLNDKTILCGFHKYDSYSNYVHIKIDKEKINIIGLKRISDEEFEGEVCGIEQYEDMLVAGNRNGMILLYK